KVEAEPQPQQAASSEGPQSAGPSFVIESEPFEEEEQPQGEANEQAAAPAEANNNNGQPQDRGWRGRRRRRGRRGNIPESRFARPEPRPAAAPERTERPARTESRSEYGPPAGYQPIILPGESISKYQRYQQPQAAAPAQVEQQAA